MSLPTLCDPIVLAAILAQESRIRDFAATILGQADDYPEDEIAIVRDHVAAVDLANELAYCHESESPADVTLYHAASQLKAWHLAALDSWITETLDA